MTAPTAEPGNLCVYGIFGAPQLWNAFIQTPAGAGVEGTATSGAIILLYEPKTGSYGRGTWAVTAE